MMLNPKSSGKRILYGFGLGIILSVILAEYASASFFRLYHDSSYFRSLTGWSPNKLSEIFLKLSWAVTFLASWWMIWKLDFLLSLQTPSSSRLKTRQKEKTPVSKREKKEKTKPNQGEEKEVKKETNEKKKKEKIDFTSLEDLRFGKILEIEDLQDSEKIKASYRKKIAQYHPDRVGAMGPEIREVAEKKAKEINEAYEHFRKKFKSLK